MAHGQDPGEIQVAQGLVADVVRHNFVFREEGVALQRKGRGGGPRNAHGHLPPPPEHGANEEAENHCQLHAITDLLDVQDEGVEFAQRVVVLVALQVDGVRDVDHDPKSDEDEGVDVEFLPDTASPAEEDFEEEGR